MLLLCGCGGGSGGSAAAPLVANPAAAVPVPANVRVSGTIAFERIGFNSSGAGLSPTQAVTTPARGIVVEALAETDREVLDSTTTDASGAYRLTVPSNTMVLISAKAQMLKDDAPPTWNVQILNNTNEDALYTLESSSFNSGISAISDRNLLAGTGFTIGGYTGTRAAAPFAILDTLFTAQELLLSADAGVVFPPLNVFWSDQNRTTGTPFCVDTGDLGTSFYLGQTGSDDCATAEAGIYLVGAFADGFGDTDEFDQHVIAHEFGHYIEDKFSRSDSIGGPHSLGDRLDLRVAFGEGWGNAISAMTLNDPVYRDSFDGIRADFNFSLEDAADDPVPGWYSEASVGGLIWDLFDSASVAEPFDVVSGFTPIFAAMTGAQRTTPALTSVFSFIQGYRAANPGATAGVTVLQNLRQISSTNRFGIGETNNGGDPSVLPVYDSVVLNAPPKVVCVNAANGGSNRLGFSKFFMLQLAGPASVSINAVGAEDPANTASVAATDPDVVVFGSGVVVLLGQEPGDEMTTPQPLTAGTYVVELLDFAASGSMTRCMTLSVTGS